MKKLLLLVVMALGLVSCTKSNPLEVHNPSESSTTESVATSESSSEEHIVVFQFKNRMMKINLNEEGGRYLMDKIEEFIISKGFVYIETYDKEGNVLEDKMFRRESDGAEVAISNSAISFANISEEEGSEIYNYAESFVPEDKK